jgi:hypothetical protein
MRARNHWIAAAVVAVAALSNAPAAYAQGSSPAPPRSTGASAASGAATPAPSADRIFTPPAEPAPTPPTVIGEGWARKLRAALDGVKQLLDVERLEAPQAIRAKDAVARPTPPPPVVPALRAAWLPASGLRDAIYRSPLQVTPVAVSPPTESPVDTRGEHAVLLGLRVELPWMVP